MAVLEPFAVPEMYKIPEEHLTTLAALYEFEADIVIKAGRVGESFTPSWSISDAVNALQTFGIEQSQIEGCVEWLWSQRRLIPLQPNPSGFLGFDKFRTDTCELIRLSSFTYPRMLPPAGIPMNGTQAGVTWRIERKQIPQRTIPMDNALEQLEGKLSSEISSHQNLAEALEIALSGFKDNLTAKGISNPMLSDFQINSVAVFIKQNLSTDEEHQLISAGTGSGKTFGFQLGVISLVILNRLNGINFNTEFLMVYPRVALALDQHSSFNELLQSVNNLLVQRSLKPIIAILDAGGQLKNQIERIGAPRGSFTSTNKAAEWTYGSKKPDVIVTNPDTLKNRLWKTHASIALKDGLRSIIMDEVHLYEGLTGANYSNVIRRLRLLCRTPPQFCGVSATIADGQQHMANVTGCDYRKVEIVQPNSEDLVLNGIVHHILHAQVEG